jgi:hypothetical protein
VRGKKQSADQNYHQLQAKLLQHTNLQQSTFAIEAD